jgi:hypothetical protein
MSGDEDFDRALRALRESGETSPADVARTRTRILETLHRGERRGRRTVWLVLPIAAVLAGSTALAKNSEVGRRVWTRVAETIGIEVPAEKAPPARPPRVIARREATGSPASDEPRAPAQEPPIEPPVLAVPTAEAAPSPAPSLDPTPPEVAARPSGHAASSAPRAGTSRERASGASLPSRGSSHAESSPPASAPVNAPPPGPEAPATTAAAKDDGDAASLQLYKSAYRLHFVEQNFAAALAGWDAYLRSAPMGSLVVEARYNRAIALVRLGRRSDAEAALGPFARGEVSGGYRAREARELLDALNASSRPGN